MLKRTMPVGPVLTHQPVKAPCMAQIVSFTGSWDGRTRISNENVEGVQAARPGHVDVLVRAVEADSGIRISRQKTRCPSCGLPTATPFEIPCSSMSAPLDWPNRQYERGMSLLTAEAYTEDPLEAVTTTRSVELTSASTRTYVLAFAPGTSAHAAPAESQRRHWYAYVSGGVPAQLPSFAVRV